MLLGVLFHLLSSHLAHVRSHVSRVGLVVEVYPAAVVAEFACSEFQVMYANQRLAAGARLPGPTAGMSL